jgi:hypothetical protein
MLLQYILPHAAIYFVKRTSPSRSKAPPQHDAATPVLHGPHVQLQTLVWLFMAVLEQWLLP